MAQKSKKQRHLDRAEIIGAYGDNFKKWLWLIRTVLGTVVLASSYFSDKTETFISYLKLVKLF